MIFETLQRRFIFVSRAVLWPVGILALLGCLWREPTAPSRTTIVLLSLWAELAVILCRVPPISGWNGNGFPEKRQALRSLAPWIPVLLVGLLLPLRGRLVYFFLLACFETVRSLWNRRAAGAPTPELSSGKNAGPPDRHPFPVRKEPGRTTVQRISRTRDAKGRDRLECLYLVEFADKQDSANVHIPFCPCFESPPRIEARLEDGAPARLTIHRAHLFGVRIDVKRTGPPDRFHLFVEITEPLPANSIGPPGEPPSGETES